MSCSDDGFRGIIDDLTIENKRLKKKIRALQAEQQASHSAARPGQLFELRVLGLPAKNQGELETLLHHFAINLHNRSAPSEEPKLIILSEHDSKPELVQKPLARSPRRFGLLLTVPIGTDE